LLGGYGGITALMGTGGELLWKYEISSSGTIAHHDALLLPNGNILTMVWHKIEKKDVKKYGYTLDVDIYPERIVEIDPKKNTIVWRWDSMDHIIQNTDPKAANYGDISKRPEKININHIQSQSGMVMHGNGLAYDAKNDLIYMSVYNFSEVWVIDHSTTPDEVRTGKGGKYNRGGDLVYRFGNPSAYGGSGTRLFYSNHHPSFSDDTTFLIYSNGIKANPEQSTAYELRLPKELDEKKPTLSPPEVVWSYTHPDLFYDKVGGVVKAPNGNYILTEGDGKIWEVTPEKELVWTYSAKPGMFWRTYVYPYGSMELEALGIEK
ncbi:aryl-sulfate sulfotransferase, partial [Candidatus Gracilibacteria bacterium]|nr:aryl-sulfate sulfotransferase [Candidatus Gracilibacteria bacterium]